MFVNVDIVGLEAVCKMIQQTALKKFIIYMQGSGKGSIPKYECTNTSNNTQAIKCFRDWATNILMYNTNNAQSYDILLFDTVNDIDTDESSKRTNKVKFSFALNNSMQTFTQHQQTPQIDISAEIAKAVKTAMLEKEVEELRQFKRDYENGELEEEEEEADMFDKITGMMQQINTAKQMENSATVSGELDEEQVMEEKINNKFTDSEKQIKLENQKKALKILWNKNKNLDEDLLRLANLAQNNPILFKMTIQKLRSMVKL